MNMLELTKPRYDHVKWRDLINVSLDTTGISFYRSYCGIEFFLQFACLQPTDFPVWLRFTTAIIIPVCHIGEIRIGCGPESI